MSEHPHLRWMEVCVISPRFRSRPHGSSVGANSGIPSPDRSPRMDRLRAWIHFLVPDGQDLTAGAVEHLARAGVTTDPLDPVSASGPGIVVFNEATPEVCDFVRRASRDGLECVMALASGPAALAGGAAWRLLRAGAADVFAWDESGRSARAVAARLDRRRAVDQLVNSPQVQNTCVGC